MYSLAELSFFVASRGGTKLTACAPVLFYILLGPIAEFIGPWPIKGSCPACAPVLIEFFFTLPRFGQCAAVLLVCPAQGSQTDAS